MYFTPSTGTGDKLRGVFTLMKDGRDIIDVFNNSKNVRLYILRRDYQLYFLIFFY